MYVIKRGDLYADGGRRWVARQRSAYRFAVPSTYARMVSITDARGLAESHAETFWKDGGEARIVRLVPRAKEKKT